MDKPLTVKDVELSLAPVISDNGVQTEQIAALNTFANQINNGLGTAQTDISSLQSSVGTHATDISSLQSSKAPLANPTFSGTVTVSTLVGANKYMVGLGQLNNTSDADKPISNATQSALNAKASTSALAATDATVSSLQSSVSSIQTTTASNSANVAQLVSDVVGHTAQLTALEDLAHGHGVALDDLTSNTLPAMVTATSTAQSTANSAVSIASGRQTVLNATTNQLPYSYVQGYNGQPNLFQNVWAVDDGLNIVNTTTIPNLQTQINAKAAATTVTALSDTVSTHTSDISSHASTLTAHQTSINANTTNIASNSASISTHAGQISTLQSDVASKQPTIDGGNLLDATLVNTAGDVLLSDALTNLSAGIASKHDTIDAGNKLAVANVDLSGSSLAHVDISAPLQAQLTSLSNSVSTLQGFDSGVTTSFAQVNADIALKNDIIDATNKLSTDYVELPSTQTLTAKLSAIDGSIATLTGLQDGDVSSFAAINATLGSHTGDITQAQTDISDLQAADAVLQSNIDGKHPLITSGAKLPVSLVDISSSALAYVDISSGLQSQLNGINTALTDLSAYDTSQTALNDSLAADIGALQTGKAATSYVDTQDALLLPKAGGTMTGVLTSVGISNSSAAITSSANVELSGTAKFKQATGASNGHVLTSDANGLASWNALPAAEVTQSSNNAWTGTNSYDTSCPTSTITPSTSSDLTRKAYVDTQDALLLPLSGGTLSGALTSVGISNSTAPITSSSNIELSGTAKFKQATGAAANYVLTSDADGLASWAPAAGGGGDVSQSSNNAFTGTNSFNVSAPTSAVTPSGASDLTRKAYVDAQDSLLLPLSGGTLSGTLNSVGISNSTAAITSSSNIELSGTAKFKQATGAAANYVLTSDADGLASWNALPAAEVTQASNNAWSGTNSFNVSAPSCSITPSDVSDLTRKAYVDAQVTTRAPTDNPTFTTKITTPAVKITTGAAANAVLTSDANGDATWQAPAGGGLTQIAIGSGDVTGDGVYNIADDLTAIIRKAYTATNSVFRAHDQFRFDPTLKCTAWAHDTTNGVVYVALSKATNQMPQGEETNLAGAAGTVWKYNLSTRAFTYATNSPAGRVNAMIFHNGYIFAGGLFQYLADGTVVNNIAKCQCSTGTWSKCGQGGTVGTDGEVFCIESCWYSAAPYVRHFFGGAFQNVDGVASNARVAYWYQETDAITPVHGGSGTNGNVLSMSYDGRVNYGVIIVTGPFTNFKTTAAVGIATLSAWTLGSWFLGSTRSVSSGTIYKVKLYSPSKCLALGDFVLDTGATRMCLLNYDTGAVTTPANIPEAGVVLRDAVMSGTTAYVTGDNMAKGVVGQSATRNSSCVWKYDMVADTWAIVGSPSYLNPTGVFLDSNGDVWIAAPLFTKLTKNYCAPTYSGKVLCHLFEDDALMVQTISGGTKYFNFSRLTGRKF